MDPVGQFLPTYSLLEDKFRDHCGIFGVYGNAEAAKLTYLGLYALQHRGQESAGIAVTDRNAQIAEPEDSATSQRLRNLP